MATLAEAVDAAETDWLVSADIPDSVDYLTVESEVVQVTATFPAQYQARDGTTSDPRIRVVRAAGGTTAASHADGTALTPLIPPSASGGGAAEAGTVVVTDPPDDIEDALIGSASPDAGNPFATLADLSGVLTVARTLTSPEILALNATPVELVPAVAGKMYWPIAGFMHYRFGTIAYDGVVSYMRIGSSVSAGLLVQPLVGFLLAFTEDIVSPQLMDTTVPQPLPEVDGVALIIGADAAITAGDGTIDLVVLYFVMDT